MVLLFLRSLRSTLIIALAIPVSLMGAIAVLYLSLIHISEPTRPY